MASDSILKKGYLYQFRSRQEVYGWERLYFVLHGQSAKNEARLDWYESLESSVSNPGLRSGIFLEEITRVERIGYQSKMEHMYGPSAFYLFGIYTCRKEEPYVMKCADAGMLNDWLKQLSKLLRDVRQLKRTDRKKAKIAETVYTMHNTPESLIFAREVDIEETAAAQRQGIRGRYRFVLSRQHLSLTSIDDSSTALFWQYSHVRRFGYSDRTFTIEGGQRSGPGEGLFILKNCEGRALFNEVQEKIRLLRQSCLEGQYPSSPVLGACSRDGAPPIENQGDDKDTLQYRPNATLYPRGENPLSSAVLLNGTAHRESVPTAGGDAPAENVYQELESEDDNDDDDEDSSGEEITDGNSTSGKKKPKVPPKNFDLGSVAIQINSQSTGYSPGKENVDKAKTKGHQSKADVASRSSRPFKRFISPPPHDAAAENKKDGSFEKLPFVNCWDESSDFKDDAKQINGSPVKPLSVEADDISRCVDKASSKPPKLSEKKPFWSFKGKAQPTDGGREARPAADAMSRGEKAEEQAEVKPPPLKPKNFRRDVTANNKEELVLVIPSISSKTKPSLKEKSYTKKKTPDKTTSAAKTLRHEAPTTPKKTVSNAPVRYIGSDVMTLQNVKVVETTEAVQPLTPFGPKISEVLLHLESCQASEPGSSSANNIDDHASKAPEDPYHRIDLRSEAAGKAKTTIRDTEYEEHHLYGQSLICQMTQHVQDEPEYEDIVVEAKPKKNPKKTKK